MRGSERGQEQPKTNRTVANGIPRALRPIEPYTSNAKHDPKLKISVGSSARALILAPCWISPQMNRCQDRFTPR